MYNKMVMKKERAGWGVAEARSRFSDLLRKAGERPQIILNRDRPVAVVVDATTFEQFEEWRNGNTGPSVSDAFEELREICEAEHYSLEIPDREDRANPAEEKLDDLPR